MKQHTLRNILALCNDSITESIAERLAERHANVVAAIQRIIPSIVNGFTSRLQESPEAGEAMMQMAGDITRIYRAQKGPARITDETNLQKGHEILQQLFGVFNVDVVGKEIARATMVRGSSALKLMQWSAPLCLSVIGKEAIEHQLDAAMMCDWLNEASQEPISPAPLWQVKKVVTEAPKAAHKKVRDHSWLHFAILVICGGVLFWILRS
jgi:hypothetical protein